MSALESQAAIAFQRARRDHSAMTPMMATNTKVAITLRITLKLGKSVAMNRSGGCSAPSARPRGVTPKRRINGHSGKLLRG